METDYQSVLSDAEGTLDAVDAALGRLSDGTYGTCERCGEAIDDARLANAPTTLDCGRHSD
ncbi:MAG TPA: TraR/DksA C4-type zinc finger protein [Acidimicrobiales bacterium]|nr:TraR/DksA C4-type zinc finger protein [Acidimicrobiales bacterium]